MNSLRFVTLLSAMAACILVAHALLASSLSHEAADSVLLKPGGIAFLLLCYFVRDADTALVRERRSTAAFRALLGSVIAGMVFLVIASPQSMEPGWPRELNTVAAPVLGLALYNVANTLWGATHLRHRMSWSPEPTPSWAEYVRRRAVHDYVYPLIGLSAAAAALSFRWGEVAGDREVPVLGGLAIALGTECLRQGIQDARYIRAAGETLPRAISRSGGYRVGMPILIVCVTAGLWGLAVCLRNAQ